MFKKEYFFSLLLNPRHIWNHRHIMFLHKYSQSFPSVLNRNREINIFYLHFRKGINYPPQISGLFTEAYALFQVFFRNIDSEGPGGRNAWFVRVVLKHVWKYFWSCIQYTAIILFRFWPFSSLRLKKRKKRK